MGCGLFLSKAQKRMLDLGGKTGLMWLPETQWVLFLASRNAESPTQDINPLGEVTMQDISLAS